MFISPPGFGKTTVMNLIYLISRKTYRGNDGQLIKYKLHNTIENKVTAPNLTTMFDNNFISFSRQCSKSNLFIDDVGREAPSKYSKKEAGLVYPLQQLFERRYAGFEKGGSILHITSNFTDPELFSKRYQSHVTDRIRGMCNMFLFNGLSKR